jgi:hypothetical protein
MLAGETQEFFRSLQLPKIADVLPVDPNAGGLLDFGGADQIDLA